MQNPHKHLLLLRELIAPKSYFALLASLFFLTILSAGTADNVVTRGAVTMLGLFLVCSISVAVSRERHTAYGMFFGGICVTACILISHALELTAIHTKFFQMAGYVLAIVYVAYSAVVIIRDVFSGQVNANRICGAICFYAMIGMCFGMLYFVMDMHDPTCFKIENFYDGTPKAGLPITVHDRYTLFNYFSFCTLSTLGYGDISPISQGARTCAWMEALFGQLYLSILVARLVGLHIAGVNGEMTRDKISNSD